MTTTSEAQRRAMILAFWEKHGIEATKDAFSVSCSTLYEWKKHLKEGNGKLVALEPKSRCPRHVRMMTTPSWVIRKVCTLRCAFPHYGKEKLRVVLADEGIAVSASTIGKIIKRYDLPSAPRQYVARRKRRKKKTRLPKEFEAKKPGDLVSMDTIEIQENGEKKYIITSLDHATRMAVAWTYKRHSSKQAKDLLLRMQIVLGVPIQAVLTDNGSEFMAHYEQACQELEIIHYWTYTNSPKMNAHSERFNRTIQEEARFPPFSSPIKIWNAWIGHYVLQYNCHRPHYALAYRRPLDQYLSCLTSNPRESSMWGTHTAFRSCDLHVLS